MAFNKCLSDYLNKGINMYRIEDNILIIDGKRINMKYLIKTCLEYNGMYVILFGGNKLFPNNIVAVDSNGDELWKINDILKIEEPSGNTVIKKKSEKILAVLSSVGMLYEIDIEQMKVVDSMIMR